MSLFSRFFPAPAFSPVVEANGARIPVLGVGTGDLPSHRTRRVVLQALALGYRHIDTAAIYGNESAVGEALRASGVERDAVFITTKVAQADLAAPAFERSTTASLVRLGVAAVDLLLVHWPNPDVPLAETIGVLCRMKRKGLARNIGVSNFPVALLDQAVALASEPLAVNQVEWHPFLDQTRLRAACARHGIALIAYSPHARGLAAQDATLCAIGKAHRKSAAQVTLRYLLQEGAIVIPRTSHRRRLKENAAVFDFALSEAEMRQIRALASANRRFTNPVGAPHWD